MQEQVDNRTVLGLEAAPLSITEPLFGKMKGSQVNKSLAGAIKAFLETSG